MSNIKGEKSVVIQADAQTVYDYISDFPRHTEWNYQPTEITKITEGPMAVGSVFRAKEKKPGNAPWFIKKIMMPLMLWFTGAKNYTEAEITTMEPNKRLSWKAVMPARKDYFMKAEWDILLEPQETATEVTQRYHYIPGLKFMEGQSDNLAQQIGEEVASNLERLKAKVESKIG